MEPKIAPLVNRCLALFETFSDSLSSSQAECSITRSHLARFRLWAGSLGAHRASGGRSLEYRLRDSSFVRNHIISLLQELVSSIGEGIQLAATDSDDKEALDDADLDLELYFQSDATDEQSEITAILGDIGHIIDCLLRLSITIRNPARHDQFNSRAGADTVSSYSEWDVKHIREKFDRLDDKLVDRLAMAMSRRRQYIKYREEHSKKLAHGLLDEPGEGENATTIASSIPKKLKDKENTAIFTKMDALLDNMSEVSGTSYANSNATTNELRVPSIPKENSWNQESFEKHVTTTHGQNFESIDLQAVLNLCRFPSDTNTVGICPFCFDYEIKSDKSYQSHIGDHLERLALFVLPKTLYDDDSDDDDNDDDDGDGDGDGHHDDDDSDIERDLMNYDAFSNYIQESRGGDSWEIELEEPDEDNMQPLHALQDYNTQLAQLEQQARQEQSKIEGTSQDGQPDIPAGFGGQPSPGTSPQAMGSGASPNPEEQMNNSSIHDSWENKEPDEGNIESTHPLMDYNMQLELLEQANKKRLMRARQEQSEMEGIPRDNHPRALAGSSGQPSPDTSPQAMKSGASPNPEEQMKRGISQKNNSRIHDSSENEVLKMLAANGINPAQLSPQQMQIFTDMPPAARQKTIAIYSRNIQQHYGNQMGNKQIPGVGGPQNQSSPIIPQGPDGNTLNAFYNPEMNPGAQAAAADSNHALQDYNRRLMQLDQENKKRIMMARQEQSEIGRISRDGQPSTPAGPNGQPSPDISPMAAKSGASPNFKDQIRHIISRMDSLGFPSPNPDDGQSLESPEANVGQAQVDSMDPPSKKVSFAKGKNIAVLPSTTLKYREDSPDFHPDSQETLLPSKRPSQFLIDNRFFFAEDEEDLDADIPSHGRLPPPSDTGTSSLKRYGSLSTFHGEGPIDTSHISAPRAVTPPGSDTIVPRPRDYSEDEDAAEEQRRFEEQSRELEELKRESDIVVEKRINREAEYRRLKEEDSADAAERIRIRKLDATQKREAGAIEKRIMKEPELRRLIEEEYAAEAAEGERRLEGDFREDAKRRFTQQQPEEIGKSEYKTKAAEIPKPMEIGEEFLEELFMKRSKEEDQDVPMDGDSTKPPFTDGVMEVEKRQGSAAPPGRCHSCNRTDTPLWRRGPDGDRTLCNDCGLQYAKLERKHQLEASSPGPEPEERDAVDAAEKIWLESDMFRDDAESPLQQYLDAMQEREARVAIEEREIKKNNLRRRKLAEEFAELQRELSILSTGKIYDFNDMEKRG
ncbi:hypothetical protein THAR02_09177 [Trichoderma harzianum]|uniref:GATA-type domain-containing protein n=1 Tax=Trichoderma harzianum TaxID=5544 RepID=A0A0F9XDN3_TRIHA|nr:hypothetical protein THAR02_09177 [Trichoderma harzianum]